MRILHTSDWHLGATYVDRSRIEEQAFFLDWLLKTIESTRADALVVAGDVFDTPNPPAEALSLYYRFLARLSALSGPTHSGGPRTAIVVGGNHDSAARLDAPRDALAALAVHVVGGYDPSREKDPLGDPAGAIIPLRCGEKDVGLAVIAVPFLNDWRIGVRGFDADADEQLSSMHDKFQGVYSRLADKAKAEFPSVPLIATGHLTCLPQRGRKVSELDSVPCEINRVGTLGAMGPTIFDERYSYVALGHIHRSFGVDADESLGMRARVRYSGSPIQVNHVEGADDRKVFVVDVDSKGVSVESLHVPVKRRLLRVSGNVEEVCAKLAALSYPSSELPPYVAVDMVLKGADSAAESKVRDVARGTKGAMAAFDIVQVRTAIERQGGGVIESFLGRTFGDSMTPERVFDFAWRTKYGSDSKIPTAITDRFNKLVESTHGSEKDQGAGR